MKMTHCTAGSLKPLTQGKGYEGPCRQRPQLGAWAVRNAASQWRGWSVLGMFCNKLTDQQHSHKTQCELLCPTTLEAGRKGSHSQGRAPGRGGVCT